MSLHPANLFSKKFLRILDISSGPGTTILGLMNFFYDCIPETKRPYLKCVAIDPVKESLKQTLKFLELFKEKFKIKGSIETISSKIEKNRFPTYETF